MDLQFNYLIYGLKLSSNRPLAGLPTSDWSDAADVTLVLLDDEADSQPFGSRVMWDRCPQRHQSLPVSVWRSRQPDDIYCMLRYSDGRERIEFVLSSDGTRIWVSWSELIQLPTVVALLLGQVLGAVLRLRNMTCLHASVVAVSGGAVAFLGSSGVGKSSIAAAMSARGYHVVSDDMAVLEEQEPGFRVQPGYPRLRLGAAVIRELREDVDRLDPVSAYTDKRYFDLSLSPNGAFAFQSHPLPLLGVYLLEERSPQLVAPSLDAMSGTEAVMALVANTYADLMVRPDLRAQELQRLSRLVAALPVRRLRRPDDLGELGSACDLVAEDTGKCIFRRSAAAHS